MNAARIGLVQQRLQLATRLLGEVAALQEGMRQLTGLEDHQVLHAKLQLPGTQEWLTLSVSAGEVRARIQVELGQHMAGALAETRRAAGDLVPTREEAGEAESLTRVV